MSKSSKATRASARTIAPTPVTPVAPTPVTPVAPTPVTPVAPTPVTAKPVKAKYAPAGSVDNGAAVITVLVPNAKGTNPTNKSATRFNTFYKPGITIAEFVAAYKLAGQPSHYAKADLRWDLQHGFISLTVPGAQS
jgi:hypothetical protein